MTLFFSAPQTPENTLTELHNTGQQPMPALVKDLEIADVEGLSAALAALDLIPLSRAVYVDAGTTATLAEQDGSIAFPFATIQQGVDALALGNGGTVLITPKVTPYADSVVIGTAGLTIDFVNLGAGASVAFNSIATNTGTVHLQGIALLGGIGVGAGSATVRLTNSSANGAVTCSALTLTNSQLAAAATCTSLTTTNSSIGGVVTATGLLTLRDSSFTVGVSTTNTSTQRIVNCRCQGTYTANGVGSTTVAEDTQFSLAFQATNADLAYCSCSSTVTTTNNLTTRFCSVTGNVTVGGAASFTLTKLSGATVGITGACTSDFFSLSNALPGLTYGSIVVQPVACRITLSVVVPAVAAGAVGYVNTSLAATKLVGMLAADSAIICYPQSDLVAAGAGGGFINARFAAANSIRMAFVGPLAGGAANFTVGIV